MGVEPVLGTESGQLAGPTAEIAGPVGSDDPLGHADWRGDVALELWVETEALPPRVRLAGRLDAATAATLSQVVRELLLDGSQEIELCTEGLRVVDSSALGALADVERMVRAEGGTLVRVGPASGPFGRSRRSSVPPAIGS